MIILRQKNFGKPGLSSFLKRIKQKKQGIIEEGYTQIDPVKFEEAAKSLGKSLSTGKVRAVHVPGLLQDPNKMKYIKHSVHFSDVNYSDNFEQREFGIRDFLVKKYEESSPEDKELYEKILKDNHKEAGVRGIEITKNDNRSTGDGIINISKKYHDQGNFGTLAHEMGHSYHQTNKKSKIGRAIHKLDEKINDIYGNIGKRSVEKDIDKLVESNYDPKQGLPKELVDKVNRVSRASKKIVGSSVSGLSGIAAGYKAEEEKEKGNKKKAKLISAGSLAVPILGHTPELGREIAASSKAMKMIKKAGANKKQIRGARKSLGYALGTYGVGLGKNLVINSGGQLVGKGAYKLTHKKKKNKKEE